MNSSAIYFSNIIKFRGKCKTSLKSAQKMHRDVHSMENATPGFMPSLGDLVEDGPRLDTATLSFNF